MEKEIKICPLLAIQKETNDIKQAGCLKGNCAWYDPKYSVCAIFSMARKK